MPLAPWQSLDRPPSVVFGRDRDAVIPLLQLHAPGLPEPRILDVTYKRGVMWKGIPVQPVERTDINGDLPNLTRVCDFRELPPEWQACFHVVVFDPPQRSEVGPNAKNRDRYGFDAPDMRRHADVTHLFEPFLLQAMRVLVPNGIVLAKMADQQHRRKRRWQCDALRATAERLGMCPCDRIIKIDPSQGERKFKGRVLHTKQRHSEWIVIRNSRICSR